MGDPACTCQISERLPNYWSCAKVDSLLDSLYHYVRYDYYEATTILLTCTFSGLCHFVERWQILVVERIAIAHRQIFEKCDVAAEEKTRKRSNGLQCLSANLGLQTTPLYLQVASKSWRLNPRICRCAGDSCATTYESACWVAAVTACWFVVLAIPRRFWTVESLIVASELFWRDWTTPVKKVENRKLLRLYEHK